MGKPLLYFTIQAAKASKCLARTILSSDDAEINAVGRSFGVDVPFVRPTELATDHASALAVAQHALRFAENEEGKQYDSVCLLQPTCPLRESVDIDAAIQMLENSDADAVVSLAQVEEPHPLKMMLIQHGLAQPLFPDKWNETLRRQDLPPTFYLNGAVYCARRAVLLDGNSLWGKRTMAYVMPAERSVNIDGLIDVKIAEWVLKS